jgi:hypothetical protein
VDALELLLLREETWLRYFRSNPLEEQNERMAAKTLLLISRRD